MTDRDFAEWYLRQGFNVISSDSSNWVEMAPRFFQAIPFHKTILPSEAEIAELIKREQLVGLRYSAPLEADWGKLSYFVTMRDKGYAYHKCHEKARRAAQKGNKLCTFRKLTIDELQRDGWDLRLDTLKRQGRVSAENQVWWERMCGSARGFQGIESMGGFIEGELAAAVLAVQVSDWYLILYHQSKSQYMSTGINNALTYHVTQEAMSRQEITGIYYGQQSLDAPFSVDEFKIRMGYDITPIKQCIALSPYLRGIPVSVPLMVMNYLMKVGVSSPMIEKCRGVLSFYVDGKKPIVKQHVPDCLSDFREL
jgi:hypothetical protein